MPVADSVWLQADLGNRLARTMYNRQNHETLAMVDVAATNPTKYTNKCISGGIHDVITHHATKLVRGAYMQVRFNTNVLQSFNERGTYDNCSVPVLLRESGTDVSYTT